MQIDLNIGWDDLSKECQKKIKELQVLGFEVELHYPTSKKKNFNEFNWSSVPQYVPDVDLAVLRSPLV